ncbi:TetR/AcrR family transcriptional regulator [Actinomadura algeriensis]|uniref:AcrR family transcriptional regulator n=1 Tax=Actinomadura algeriensis TaxID=1679523 RepID=A0ABR9K408_9ACTN|nr:TetR/AcrR family transcriptional regulator [Actinomadura algeriensis]MBE1537418.1 AcrR family transcriptional regulator [Actinomadura algeriensis]
MTAQKDVDARERILRAAARLIAESGGEPVSTRAICGAAGVGAPTLYHHFGDKQGLFDAVAAYGFERYLSDKRAQPSTGDPVEDLRQGWELHQEFGRSNPELYTLMYGTARRPPAAAEAHEILLGLVGAVARAGRLRVPVEAAANMIHAAGTGVMLALVAGEGDPGLPDRMCEALFEALIVPAGPGDGTSGGAGRAGGGAAPALAVALRAALAAEPASALTATEAALLGEWLDRIAGARPDAPA